MGAPDLKQPLAAQLVMTPELSSNLERESRTLDVVKKLVIDSPEMAQAANDELKDIKQRLKRVDEWYERFIEPLKQLRATTDALFGPARTSLRASEAHLKNALLDYQKKEQERIEAERRAREEAERKARQEAERIAAAERARAEERAREERRKAQEAEEARKRAEAEGNARAAREAAARAAAAEERAAQAIENGEAKAAAAQLEAATAAQAAPQVQEQTRLAGFATRDNWVAELEPGKTDDDVKPLVVAAIAAGRTDLMALIALDMKAAAKLAKALKQSFNVPGMKAVNKPVAASRS